MKSPLIFMPILNLSQTPGVYQMPLATRFLKAYQGLGHIIMPEPLHDLQPVSYAITKPAPNHPLHLPLTDSMPRSIKASVIDLVVACPQGILDPAWHRINRVYQKVPVRRLILTRQGPDHRLDVLDRSIDALSSAIQSKFFLDLHSFGWDAVGHFVSRYPDLQIEGVSDRQLWHLMHLAEVLDRPLHLDDLSEHPRLIPSLPHHKVPDPPVVNVHRVPFPVQYR